MKLLISTYACAPHHGSEHGVGWNWTTEACRQGHEVWAMASPVHRAGIEAACREDPVLCRINWCFPEVWFWPLAPGQEPKWERSYNLLWQISARHHARKLQNTARFDAVHHLTWGGVRAPTFLASLGPPLIIGPIGGGEASPKALRDELPLRGKLAEWIRGISNATIALNPLVRGGLAAATMIFVRTPETRQILSRAMQAKSVTFSELVLLPQQIGTPRKWPATSPRLLFVGRLLHWKGAHIAIRALAELVRHMPAATLTIVGSGPEQPRLAADIARYGLTERVTFVAWLARDEVTAIYDNHDLLLFPSLHDSGGTVVLESIARGTPVVCLDLGGPGQIVTGACGSVVATAGLNTARLAKILANEIVRLCGTPALYLSMSAGAIARAREFALTDRVAAFYRLVSNRLAPAIADPAGLPQAPARAKRIAESTLLQQP